VHAYCYVIKFSKFTSLSRNVKLTAWIFSVPKRLHSFNNGLQWHKCEQVQCC